MKNSVKLFGLLMISVVLFSCSTDEQDADLERAIQISKDMQDLQGKDGDVTPTDSLSRGEGTPVLIVKKD